MPRKSLLLLIALVSSLISCEEREDDSGNIRTINGNDFQIEDEQLIQVTEDEDKTVKFGVIADPHGYYENVSTLSNYFKQQGVDAIIMLGDYAQHFRKKPNQKLSDYDEIVLCLKHAAETGLPVYVVPGNHDMREYYKEALKKLSKYKNIFDLSEIRIVDGDDFDLVSNPFGTDRSYINASFRGTDDQIRQLGEYIKLVQNDDDPEIIVMHQPPKCEGEHGIDVNFDGENEGNEITDEVMIEYEVMFSLSAHIHEAGGKGVNSDGELVKQGTFSRNLRFNPGAACPWKYFNGKFYTAMAGIFTIEGDSAKYDVVKLQY